MAASLPQKTRVLIVGGGPVGFVVSSLLSEHGIANLVVERRREAQRAPAAHVLRRRPMAIFDRLGVGDEIRGASSSLDLDFITWCATLGGVEIGRLDLRRDPATGQRLPAAWTNCSQNLLEPILQRHASSQPGARVERGAECINLSQRDGRVCARIHCDDGSEHTVEAAWVIAADGAGSPSRRRAGIPMEGLGPLARFSMVHLEADLTPWIADRSGPIYWIMNPEAPATLIVHDPMRSHVLMMPRVAEGDGDGDDSRIRGQVAKALGVPVEPKILSIDAWAPHVQVAARYREGRIFLAGDAAHRFPPTGGLGLNTGIQEAAVLVDKLASVEAGTANEASLDEYEEECRPIALANADESFENMKRLGEISRVIGSCADLLGLEKRLASLNSEERQALAKAIELQRSHFLSDGS